MPSISNGTFVLVSCFEWPKYTLQGPSVKGVSESVIKNDQL